MVFPVVGGNQSTGDFITNSLRFNNPDDPNLSTTFSSAGNRRTFTISAWVKRGNIADDHTLFGQGGTSSGNPRGVLFFANSLRFTNNTSGSSTDTDVETNAKTRDPSAWYHAVVAVDTTQGTNSNRVKLYINGELQTSLATATYPDQNFEMGWNNNVLHTVGRYPNNDAYHMDGYISEFYFIDGTQYAASDFGETNDNGVWIPKDAKDDLTFGTNGFYLQFQQTGTGTNASGMGADTSGNDNHLAVNNLAATDVTTDTPTNNFATLSSIDVNVGQVPTFAEGNTKFTVANGNNHARTDATIRPSSGKWYAEFTFLSGYSTANGTLQVGIISGNAGRNSSNNDGYDQDNGNDSEAVGYLNNGSVKNHGTQSLSSLTTFTTNDIMGIALDLDNDKFFVSKNGTFFTNGTGTQDPANGTNPLYSGGVITSHKSHGFNIGAKGYGSTQNVIAANFGNPHTAISSGNTDGLYGNFEYAPPSGYYALCTKRLAEYG